jgi:hypothetical protein
MAFRFASVNEAQVASTIRFKERPTYNEMIEVRAARKKFVAAAMFHFRVTHKMQPGEVRLHSDPWAGSVVQRMSGDGWINLGRFADVVGLPFILAKFPNLAEEYKNHHRS